MAAWPPLETRDTGPLPPHNSVLHRWYHCTAALQQGENGEDKSCLQSCTAPAGCCSSSAGPVSSARPRPCCCCVSGSGVDVVTTQYKTQFWAIQRAVAGDEAGLCPLCPLCRILTAAFPAQTTRAGRHGTATVSLFAQHHLVPCHFLPGRRGGAVVRW